jgi:hypothetical protein
MPIPFLLVGGIASAVLGVGKGIKAGADQKDAEETNGRASYIVERATQYATEGRERCSEALEELGRKKIWVLDNSLQSFTQVYGQLHSVELGQSPGMKEVQKFRMDDSSFRELKQMSEIASSVAGGMAGGAATGALAAIGAYGGAATFGTCATTGTAIATLSGVAAENATLAFLGGGALSIGGLGVTGGMAVLGGLVAGPALAVMGFVAGAKAAENKEAAYSNLAKARAYEEEVETMRVLCKAIRMRANMFELLLVRLDAILVPLTEQLAHIIQKRGEDYTQYKKKEKAVVGASLAVAKAMKTVLDTPILTEAGELTEQSRALIAPTQSAIKAYAKM